MKLKDNTAYHITVQGEINEIVPKNGRDFQLEEVQSLVDSNWESWERRKRTVGVFPE